MTPHQSFHQSAVVLIVKAKTMLRGLLCGAVLALVPTSYAHSSPYSPQFVQGDGTRIGGYFIAGSEGATIAIPGGATVRVEPGASVRVFPRAQRLRMPTGRMVRTWSVAVRSGRVSTQVTMPDKSAVLLAASSKFSVVVANGNGGMVVESGETVAVNEQGEAYAIVDGKWSSLAERAILIANGEGQLTKEITPSAPKLDAGQRLWVSTGAPVKLDGIRWTPVSGAVRYEVALYQRGEAEPLLKQVTQKPELGVPFRPLDSGQFDLAVRSVDRRGLNGPWSERVPLRVVGVALPDGAYVSSGSIHLGQGQKARFTHADGLFLTHPGTRTFLPGTSLVPLHGNARTMVSFRMPGTANLTTTELLPRPVRAKIKIGPKTARWPRDEVKVSVSLSFTEPGGVPIMIEAHPRVMIGIDPVEVDWRRRGDHLEGIVPPSAEAGPWVVRVEVEDQFGVPLGRDFLEVATTRAPR